MIPISTNQGHLMCPVTKMNNSCLMITQGSMASMVKFAEFRYFRCRLQWVKYDFRFQQLDFVACIDPSLNHWLATQIWNFFETPSSSILVFCRKFSS